MELKKLMDYTGELLQIARFQDYCPNGLQVEGRGEIRTIVSGVTASMALLDAAAEMRADLVLVHHGYFWRNEDPRILGMKRSRLKFLLEQDINLAAYHLPLDAHPELGNNAQLGRVMGVALEGLAGEPAIIAHGSLSRPATLQAFGAHLESALRRQPMLIGDPDRTLKRIAWCTGAAQSHFEEALALGVDAFISGEISEQTVHLARESGVAYIAAGHHATERYGIQALGEHLADKFRLQHAFIDIDNPV
ncbi:MAG TPA: Nif3-like dinuclear metal center hexameric protein [Methylophilaceae bacterium]|nr:Nif3-like dinuclear metal center hexameric protein [Methylophilaceae bacterium]